MRARRPSTMRIGVSAGAITLLVGATTLVIGSAHGASASRVDRQAGVVTAASQPAPTSASIVIDQGAMMHGFTTTTVVMARGGILTATNRDGVNHTVTSEDDGRNNTALFDTVIPAGRSVVVPGASKLAPGTYGFYCAYHPNMTGKLIITGTGGGFKPVAQTFTTPLAIPRTVTAAHIKLSVQGAWVPLLPGRKTAMWTYGGTYPGPTIRRTSGSATTLTVTNRLPAKDGQISTHLHGDHHTAVSDGQPTVLGIPAGGSRTYTYPLRDGGRPVPPSFSFYHDHEMGATGRNNWNGLQGMSIVDDGRERALRLPVGGYDVPLLIADRGLDSQHRLMPVATAPMGSMSGMGMTGAGAPPGDATVGSDVLVDGRYAPYLNVATHRYRIRLLNASNYRSYDFALSSGQSFTQIGTGSSLLPKPVTRQDILLGPAQRADVIVDFNGEYGRKIVLASVPRRDGSKTGTGTPSVSIMQFRVTKRVTDDTLAVPRLEATPAITVPKKPSFTWDFNLGGDSTTGTYWAINGQAFNASVVQHTVKLGSTESWVLHNSSTMTHYIHIHEEQWHTVSRDGKPPPAYELGLQDTWRLDPGETVVVAAKFTDYLGNFMIHCHMLDHEDHGMMAQFRVVR